MAVASLTERIRKIRTLAKAELVNDEEVKRVEIIMLKFKEEPAIIDKAIHRINHHTHHPYKLTIFDNRLNPPNTSRIWNKLIRESTCRYVLIIDSDAFVPTDLSPCWLTRMMESIDRTGFVIPVCTSPGGAHQHVSSAQPYGNTKLNKDAWSGFCFLFDKEALQKTGYFDERFYIYGQDSEFALRVGKQGGAVMRLDVLVEHIGGYSFKKDPIREDDKLYARTLFEYLAKKL